MRDLNRAAVRHEEKGDDILKTILLNKGTIPQIAVEGESGTTAIAVDCGAWAADFPLGAGAMIFQRADGETYPLTIRQDERRVRAELSGTETAFPGLCAVEAQWRLTLDGEETVIAKDGPYRFRVAPAMGGRVIAAEPPGWVESVLQAADRAEAAMDASEAKGQEILASLPADYTALAQEVSGLHARVTALGGEDYALEVS